MLLTNIKAFDLYSDIYNNNSKFRNMCDAGMNNGLIRFFGDEEWHKIKSQNYVSFLPDVKEFADIFYLGYNIGDCVGVSKQLSYSYYNASIVSGILPVLKGYRNSEKEGGHCWLESDKYIIDTSLMLVIDKKLKDAFGYIEEMRLTPKMLHSSSMYMARMDFTNSTDFKR